ncbi:MAG: hypothetical protein M1834_009563 [Cirrosporium novae-zelandiae]|nr:MAG: hypothetical protein M1834_009563 [Cirrosporium novae-zelandiae]
MQPTNSLFGLLSLLALGATSVFAHPSTNHLHRYPHEVIKRSTADGATTTPAPNATIANYHGVAATTYRTSGFGARTSPTTVAGNSEEYVGNVGNPWGSNIIIVDADVASEYKYTVRFMLDCDCDDTWFVSIWNKIGPDGLMDGWYGHSAVSFTLTDGDIVWVAFDENSQGAWGTAKGTSLPTDSYGGYDSTWGEFDFGDGENSEWSGWDVSDIQAVNAGATVQGMRICTADFSQCSIITSNGDYVDNAYTPSTSSTGGIGGVLTAGAVTLWCRVDYVLGD